MTDLFKKTKRIYELDRTTYYHNYEISYYQWFYAMFKGIVILISSDLFIVPLRLEL